MSELRGCVAVRNAAISDGERRRQRPAPRRSSRPRGARPRPYPHAPVPTPTTLGKKIWEGTPATQASGPVSLRPTTADWTPRGSLTNKKYHVVILAPCPFPFPRPLLFDSRLSIRCRRWSLVAAYQRSRAPPDGMATSRLLRSLHTENSQRDWHPGRALPRAQGDRNAPFESVPTLPPRATCPRDGVRTGVELPRAACLTIRPKTSAGGASGCTPGRAPLARFFPELEVPSKHPLYVCETRLAADYSFCRLAVTPVPVNDAGAGAGGEGKSPRQPRQMSRSPSFPGPRRR